MRYFVAFFLLTGLGACGDPLAKIEKIDDVDLATDEPIAQALTDADEVQSEGGFLSRLIARQPTVIEAPSVEIAQPTPLANAGLEDTVAPVAPPSPAGEVAEAPSVEVPEPAPSGIRGWLRRSADKAKAQDVAAAPVPDTQNTALEPVAAPEIAAVQTQETETAAEVTPALAVEAEKRKGLFGFLKPAEKEATQVRTASLSPEIPSPTVDALATPVPELSVEPKKRRGLFGGNAVAGAARKGPDARDVDYGEVVPFGEVARVCSARGRPMGRKIDKAPARGRGYALYDSDPNSAAPRTFYVTGFRDDCPRQFTAALALMGAPTLHEQLRYGLPSSEYPYSTTDKAYEKVKSSVCGVSKRKPCGAKIGHLEKTTVFVSIYERFGNNARWADVLIHDGAVLAAAIKQP